jgi:transcriptional regulator with GAF, ATPase, and Fis domain
VSKLEECARLIERAKRCMEDFDKRCMMTTIEEMIRNNCHNGKVSETASEVRELIHEFWVTLNYIEKGELLKMLWGLGVTRTWLATTLHKKNRDVDYLLQRYGIKGGDQP